MLIRLSLFIISLLSISSVRTRINTVANDILASVAIGISLITFLSELHGYVNYCTVTKCGFWKRVAHDSLRTLLGDSFSYAIGMAACIDEEKWLPGESQKYVPSWVRNTWPWLLQPFAYGDPFSGQIGFQGTSRVVCVDDVVHDEDQPLPEPISETRATIRMVTLTIIEDKGQPTWDLEYKLGDCYKMYKLSRTQAKALAHLLSNLNDNTGCFIVKKCELGAKMMRCSPFSAFLEALKDLKFPLKLTEVKTRTSYL